MNGNIVFKLKIIKRIKHTINSHINKIYIYSFSFITNDLVVVKKIRGHFDGLVYYRITTIRLSHINYRIARKE